MLSRAFFGPFEGFWFWQQVCKGRAGHDFHFLEVSSKTNRSKGQTDQTQTRSVMMRKVELEPRNESFLSAYRLPEITFEATELPYPSLSPLWEAMREGNFEEARTLAHETMQERRIFPAAERAAIKVALATAELNLGATDTAKRMAGRSLDLHSNQFSAHRILLTVYMMRKDYTAAYLHLANLPLPKRTPKWDEKLAETDVHVALAAWAWQLGEWDQVADHLQIAYPGGLSEMPANVREDWFRLSLYRGLADDAAAAAESLIEGSSIHRADELLQTIVQSGWTKQALPLYRKFFQDKPESELLRRRLVALCVKEGQMQEARELAQPSALKLAA